MTVGYFRVALVSLCLAVVGCGEEGQVEETASSAEEIGFAKSGDWTVFPLQTGPNPAAKIDGSVRGFISPEIGRTMLSLSVSGLPANKTFGAHLHATSCADNKGSGHYQHAGAAINAENEVWLDVTTDERGRASVLNRKPYAVAAEKAKSVVVHANATDPVTGKAGDKLACVDVAFVDATSGVGSPGRSCSSAYQCVNGACTCSGPKAGTTCASANECEKACSVCK